MSYILFNTESTPVSYPISVANGGTGETDAVNAMITLSSPAFQVSAVAPDWGTQNVDGSLAPDAFENFTAINNLNAALKSIGVIV